MPFVAVALLLSVSTAEEKVYDVAGVQREATIIAPSRSTPNPPLIFGFHGHGGNRRNAARSFRLEQLWPEAIVVYMQGLPTPGMTDPNGEKNGWQQNAGEQGDRDLAFFDTVLEDVSSRFRVAPSRTFSMGHSNGGRFSYLLWSKRGDKFAAFGPSASPVGLMPIEPKPAFIMAGETDEVVRFASQQRSINRVLRIDGHRGDGKKIAEYTTRYDGATPVITYVHPDGHRFTSEAMPMMITFFREIVSGTIPNRSGA